MHPLTNGFTRYSSNCPREIYTLLLQVARTQAGVTGASQDFTDAQSETGTQNYDLRAEGLAVETLGFIPICCTGNSRNL